MGAYIARIERNDERQACVYIQDCKAFISYSRIEDKAGTTHSYPLLHLPSVIEAAERYVYHGEIPPEEFPTSQAPAAWENFHLKQTQTPMLTSTEFKTYTGGEELTPEIEALYLALPQMNKKAFCRLYLLNKVLQAAGMPDLFGKLRGSMAVHATLGEAAAAAYMDGAVAPFCETQLARDIEAKLLKIVAAMDKAAAVTA